MTWIDYPLYSSIIVLLWLVGFIILIASYQKKQLISTALITFMVGWAVLLYFVKDLWVELQRPPMRTLGETRLWYAVFLPLVGIITYLRWHYKWFLGYSMGMASLFLVIN